MKTQFLSTSLCSACKIQRKKCTDKCILAPYFPQADRQKFLIVHRVFGHGQVIKLLQDLPADKRGDAVNSIVYEASERLRDPVHGCLGVVNDMNKKVAELESQLASTEAALAKVSLQHANLLPLVTGYDPNFYSTSLVENEDTYMNPHVLDDVDPIELMRDLRADKRGDAVNSIVYAASERLRDPVHGCLGVVNDMNKKVAELESQLASTEAALAKDLQADKRGDAVNSIVYEASERLRDPIHGCLGVVNDMNKKVAELESQLASTEAALAKVSLQHANLLPLVTGYDPNFYSTSLVENEDTYMNPHVLDDVDPIELMRDLLADKRGDAVNSIVYAASERLRDPIHGCLGIVNDMNKKVAELESQLASTEAALAKVSLQHANLLPLVTGYDPNFYSTSLVENEDTYMNPHVLDDVDPIELMRDLPADKRGDAVNNIVYAASERLRDPVHGCLGVVNDMNKKVAELESQLASTEAALAKVSLQHANLLPLVTGYDPNFYSTSLVENEDTYMNPHVLDDADPNQLWKPFWN